MVDLDDPELEWEHCGGDDPEFLKGCTLVRLHTKPETGSLQFVCADPGRIRMVLALAHQCRASPRPQGGHDGEASDSDAPAGERRHALPFKTPLLESPGQGSRQLAERVCRLIESSNVELSEKLIHKVIELLRPLPESAEAGRRLRQAELTLQAQRRFCEHYEMLAAGEVHRRSGSKSRYPSATASRWAQAGRVIGLRTGAGLRYPSFQFDAAGQPRKAMARLIAVFGGVAADPWALALRPSKPSASPCECSTNSSLEFGW